MFLKQDQKFLYSEIKQTDQSDIGEYEQIFCESVLISIDKVNEKQGTAKITVKIPNLNNIYDDKDSEEVWFQKVKDFASKNGYATDKKDFKENPDKYIGMVATFCALLRVIICKKNMSPNIYYLIKYLGKEELIERTEIFYKKQLTSQD